MHTAEHRRLLPSDLAPKSRTSLYVPLAAAVVAFVLFTATFGSVVLSALAAGAAASGAVVVLRLLAAKDDRRYPGTPLGVPSLKIEPEPVPTYRAPKGKRGPGVMSRGGVVVRVTQVDTPKPELMPTIEAAGELVDSLRSQGLATLLTTGQKTLGRTPHEVEIVIRDDRTAGQADPGLQASMANAGELLKFVSSGAKSGTGKFNWKVISSNKDPQTGHWTAVVAAGSKVFSFRLAGRDPFKAAVQGTPTVRRPSAGSSNFAIGRSQNLR